MSRFILAALAATVSCALLLGVTSSAGAQTAPRDLTKRVPVTGTAKNGKKFKGTYTIDRHVTRRDVRIPVSGFAQQTGAGAAQIACNVLTLTLGPLDLNLLGLRVQLNQVNLRITAIPGGGLRWRAACGTSALAGRREEALRHGQTDTSFSGDEPSPPLFAHCLEHAFRTGTAKINKLHCLDR